jgi:hypothetical protein
LTQVPKAAKRNNGLCTVESILAASQKTDGDGKVVYSCQATQLREYSSTMSPWNPSQYIRDVTSGNLSTGLADDRWMSRVLDVALATIRLFRGLVIGIFIGRMGRTFYPALHGALDKTPSETLDLQAGELVQVRSIPEIVATLNRTNHNRGLLFDGEMTPYCGGIYRVLRRVHHIINEKTGKMMDMKYPCIVLEGVVCKSDYHRLCPRAIYSYWRENWLRRVVPVTESAAPQERNMETCQRS